jgi:hypothetical protein
MNDTHGSCTGAARSTSGHWAAHGHARNTRGPRTTVQGHRPCMGEPRRPRAALGRCAQGRAVPGIARTALGHCALRRGHCTCASRRAALAGRHGMPGRRAWPRHAAGGRGGSSARGVEVRGGRRDLPLRRQQLQARRVRRGGREEGRGGRVGGSTRRARTPARTGRWAALRPLRESRLGRRDGFSWEG